MRMQISNHHLSRSYGKAASRGFTLTEILVAMTIFMAVIGGILAANILGLRMMQVNQTKLAATEWSRNTFGKLTDEIHTCNNASVGNINSNGFVGILEGEPQAGNALMILPTTNATNYILYFFNPSDSSFRRITSQDSTGVQLAESVTNTAPIFTAQDLYGNVLTNNVNNRVIHVTLDIYQSEHYLSAPDYYQLETAVTRRALQ